MKNLLGKPPTARPFACHFSFRPAKQLRGGAPFTVFMLSKVCNEITNVRCTVWREVARGGVTLQRA